MDLPGNADFFKIINVLFTKNGGNSMSKYCCDISRICFIYVLVFLIKQIIPLMKHSSVGHSKFALVYHKT